MDDTTAALTGLTWDHPRAIAPLRAVSEAYEQECGIKITWHARPLHAFEDQPVKDVADAYDLLSIDHPSIGDAVAAGALVALDHVAPSEDAIGPSAASYRWGGSVWALPVDAACMVGALHAGSGLSAPRSWPEAIDLARSLGPDRVLLPANPTHILCTLLTICQSVSGTPAQSDGSPSWWDDGGIRSDVLIGAVDILRELVAACSPSSLGTDPIGALEALSTGSVLYVPLTFGYVSYSGDARVAFVDAPGGLGSLVGGVGLAISSRRDSVAESIDFATYVTGETVQRGLVAAAGGQPALAAAWSDPEIDRNAGGFYSSTVTTMKAGILRPRRPGYPAFQVAAGAALTRGIVEGVPATDVARDIAAVWRSAMGGGHGFGGHRAEAHRAGGYR